MLLNYTIKSTHACARVCVRVNVWSVGHILDAGRDLVAMLR